MTPDYAIRPAQPGDVAAIAALTDAAYARYVPILGRRPVPMTWDYDRVVAEWQVWVAEDDEYLVGVLVLVPDDRALLIESVAVAPSAQGRGVGRGLLDHAVAVANTQGAETLRLYTNARMTDNIALYRRYGFVITDRKTHRDREIVHMSIDVSAHCGPAGQT